MARSQSGRSRGTKGSTSVGVTDGTTKISTGITGGKNRELQIRKTRPTEWTEAAQAIFLGQLAMTGNVTTSAAAASRSLCGAYRRRSRDPAFAAKWQAALVQGYERLEELLLATALESIGGRAIGDHVGAADVAEAAGGDSAGGDAPAVGAVASRLSPKQAVPGAGLIQLSSVTAIQFALAMLNQHRADQLRGRKTNQTRRATSVETDAVLAKLLDSLARRRTRP